MSVHCLICGHQDNWRDDGEYATSSDTWRVIAIFKDRLTEKYEKMSKKERLCDSFYVHTDCLVKWLTEECSANITKEVEEGMDKLTRFA